MHKMIVAAFLAFVCILCCTVGMAQEVMPEESVQMADGMRSDGKIYVVVAVLVTVLTGIFLYIIRLDKRISRMEKQAN